MTDLADRPLAADSVGLLEGLTTTRSIRRYADEPIPDGALRDILFAATRAPSGSNRQNFRFIVLTDGPVATEAKAIIGRTARQAWDHKRANEGYDEGSGATPDSPKARMARSMERYVEEIEKVPALVLPCLIRHRRPTSTEGASVYPACQNLLLAARALGYGGVLTIWHALVEDELRQLLELPDEAAIAATVTLGKPEGNHGPVRRVPLDQLVYSGTWGDAPEWAVDPPGTRFTRAGPPPAPAS
ncbi:MAG: nitroreductase family protein [Acidimicrobiales bacterium]|jgi:nitroreductase|nr:nitroreductase family protein [Acidimicrobiales bacterium]